jgi:glycosyltransferase involved in cell wall biosynthesis
MIKIGIIIPALEGWMGGINYAKNLLYAVSSLPDKKIEFVLFFGKKSDEKLINSFKGLGEIVRTSILDKSNLKGLLNYFLWRFFGSSFLMAKELEKKNIDVVSHSRFFLKNSRFKKINWIPDFQHLKMPKMFSLLENKYRDFLFKSYAKTSDFIILSSEDSKKYYKKEFPKYLNKVKVIRFVSQPDKRVYKLEDIRKIKKKYGFSGIFFYLPNQIWRHKNHILVLKALRLLKEEGKNIFVLCSGNNKDYRNKKYFKEILGYVKRYNLENNIKFLGVIDYIEVLALMRHCVSVINPSLFEGWSSTVEEAKSIGKNLILSDLAVHKEQNPPSSIYFNPNDARDLANKLWEKWTENKSGPDFELEKNAKENIQFRTRKFGEKYQETVKSLILK